VAKHLIDTDLYIDLIQSGGAVPIIRELYQKDAPGIFLALLSPKNSLRVPALRRAKGMSNSCWRPLKEPGGLSPRLTKSGKKRETCWLAF
jgi:hypothetical protein